MNRAGPIIGIELRRGTESRLRGSTVSPVNLSPNNPLSPVPKKVSAKPEAISQPPLIITPKITIEAPETPSNLQSISKNVEPEKIIRPLRAKVKPSEKFELFDIVKVLDEKGSMHLGRCLKKLNNKVRERHFLGFSEELETLETLTNSPKKETSPIRKLFTQSPSQKDCINYLDFILMAG